MKRSVVFWVIVFVSVASVESSDIFFLPRDMRMPKCGVYMVSPGDNPIVVALELDPQTAEWKDDDIEVVWGKLAELSIVIAIAIDTCPYQTNGVVFEIDGEGQRDSRWMFTEEGVILMWPTTHGSDIDVVSLITFDGDSENVLWIVRSETQYIVLLLRMYFSLDISDPDAFSPRW